MQSMAMQGLRLMDLYTKKGVDPKRIYIKVRPIISGGTERLLKVCCMRQLAADSTAAGMARATSRPQVGLPLEACRSVEGALAVQIASTWEGIRACEELQKQGIDTNMTLLFSFGQVCAACMSWWKGLPAYSS